MPQKSRAAKISIDVGERDVNIIKKNGSGIIVKAGSAELSAGMPDSPNMQYTASLAYAITQAAKSARIRGGDCVMVVGGAQIITRSFVWPEMPPDALQLNAESEITHYLPSEIEQYVVDYRVLRRNVSERDGNPVTQLDVLVAAMTKDMAQALLSAAKAAGFSPDRIDIRENAREKLMRSPRLWQKGKARKSAASARPNQELPFDFKDSFAMLHASDTLVDMTVFLNGVFYVSRYFGNNAKSIQVPVGGENAAATEEYAELVSEIASTVDYIQYRERGLKIESILLFGDETASRKLAKSLMEYMEVPVFQLEERIAPIVKAKKRGRISASLFLDAYSAAIIPSGNNPVDLSLKPKKIKRRIFRRVVLPVLGLILVLGTLLAAGIYFQHMRILELEQREERLAAELARYSVSEDVAGLQREVSAMTKMLEEYDEFSSEYEASGILSAVYGALPSGAVIDRISVGGGGVSLSGFTDTLDKVADFVRNLRSEEMFVLVNAQTARSYQEADGFYASFEITLTLPAEEDEE